MCTYYGYRVTVAVWHIYIYDSLAIIKDCAFFNPAYSTHPSNIYDQYMYMYQLL